MENTYDVCILGGGLAGLTLSIQLKKENPEISILVLEMRKDDAPDAAHKVGESTVELGTYYIREVLNLKDYLDEHQLPKEGLRFFLTPQHKNDISKRVELGPKATLPVPSHQLDRGTLENELANRAKKNGVDVFFNAKVNQVDFDENKHTVRFKKDGEEIDVKSRWVVDASGRSSFLKRKLGFKKELSHNINAAWFRVKGEIDVADWSENKEWVDAVKPGLRRLGTIHFMDKGYWVWFIPLATGNTSIGIVADPRHHPFEKFNKYEKAMDWLKENEPVCYEQLNKKRDDVLDFKILKHYSHHSEKLYSTDRWAVVGDSGVFLDPFYSPGTDFIAITNTFVTDLIARDKKGEDIFLRTNVFEQAHFSLFNNWVPIYEDKYQLWGLTQTMILKIYWDWLVYWAVPTLLFTNNAFTNIAVLKELFSSKKKIGHKFGQLNLRMQEVFVEWGKHETKTISDSYIDLFDSKNIEIFHKGIDERYDPKDLILKIHDNVAVLEDTASQIFRLMSTEIYGTSDDLKVNPYEMTLNVKPTNVDGGNEYVQSIKEDVDTMWLYN
ncbi:MAG: NAD(P)/FAD-dependent oxidoreductase [Vicingaceae bacterium]